VISIPTVRGRLVLGVLNKYLQYVFSDCIKHDVPNQLIKVVRDCIDAHAEKNEELLSPTISSSKDRGEKNMNGIPQGHLLNIPI